jgi:GT2 family glycosyltransferase
MFNVAIHIVTHNNASTIDACLDSVLAQEQITYELLIVDNASEDQTVEHIRAYGIVPFVNSYNMGYAAAHNQAITKTSAPYILTLNPDARLAPLYLYHIIEIMKSHPEVGSACGTLLRIEHIEQQTSTTIDGLGIYMRRNRRQGLRFEGQSIDCISQLSTPVFGVDGAAAVYRRTMLEDIAILGEIFDEDFFIHKEDIDLCWRAQLMGWLSLNVPEAIAYHIRTFRPGKRAAVSSDLRYFGLRNRYFLMLKNEIGWHFLIDLLPILTYDLAIFFYVLLREQASLRAYGSLFSQWSRMLKKRKIIQSKKVASDHRIRQWFTNKI